MSTNQGIVAVTGATGRQGGAVARHLLADGWEVRALTRRPGSRRARRLAGLGAHVQYADLADRAALAEAFRGAHGVFSVQNPMTCGVDAEIAQGRNVGEAALEAGVAHLVHASAGVGVEGTGVGSWESKLVVRAHLHRLGLPVTVLRPMAFMELMTDHDFVPPVSTWHLMPKLMGWDRPVPWVCVDDVGRVAACVFANPARYVGREIPLAADVRSLAECRELWTEVRRRRPRAVPLPVALFERFVGTDLTTMWRWLRDGQVDLDTSRTRAVLPAALGVREWLVWQRAGQA